MPDETREREIAQLRAECERLAAKAADASRDARILENERNETRLASKRLARDFGKALGRNEWLEREVAWLTRRLNRAEDTVRDLQFEAGMSGADVFMAWLKEHMDDVELEIAARKRGGHA